MTMHKALLPRDNVENQEKREEKDLPALKTALTHRYNGLKTTQKNTNED